MVMLVVVRTGAVAVLMVDLRVVRMGGCVDGWFEGREAGQLC